jgi:hypothetical protein
VRGTTLTTISSGGEFTVSQTAWDVDDTVLAVASEGHGQAVLRFDREGNIYRVTPVRQQTDGDVYRFATRP